MHIWIYIGLWALIGLLWTVVGKLEWQVPSFLGRKIQNLSGPEAVEAIGDDLILSIEAREFTFDDIEKEIYIIRKSRKLVNQHIVMNVKLDTELDLDANEREKTKVRLEKRFPGLLVHYTQRKQKNSGDKDN